MTRSDSRSRRFYASIDAILQPRVQALYDRLRIERGVSIGRFRAAPVIAQIVLIPLCFAPANVPVWARLALAALSIWIFWPRMFRDLRLFRDQHEWLPSHVTAEDFAPNGRTLVACGFNGMAERLPPRVAGDFGPNGVTLAVSAMLIVTGQGSVVPVYLLLLCAIMAQAYAVRVRVPEAGERAWRRP